MTDQLERNVGSCEEFPESVTEVEIKNGSPSIVVLQIHAEANSDQADVLATHLKAVVGRAPRFVILDLANLDSISGAALHSLVEFRRSVCWQGCEVWLARLRPAVWLALHATGLEKLFTIRDSVAQVFAS